MAWFYGVLLLPPPPRPPTPPAIRAAYKPTFDAVVKRIAEWSRSDGEIPTLDVALPCPNIRCSTFGQSEYVQNFDIVQRLVSSAYSLLGTTIERSKTQIDARIILIDYDRDCQYAHLDRWGLSEGTSSISSVVRFPVFASSRRLWIHCFAVEGEAGERLFQQFLLLSKGYSSQTKERNRQTERVRGGLVLQEAAGSGVEHSLPRNGISQRCRQVIISGTHHLDFEAKVLLSMAAFLVLSPSHSDPVQQSCRIVIGLKEDPDAGNDNPKNGFVGRKSSGDYRQEAFIEFLLAILQFSPTAFAPASARQSKPACGGKTTMVELSSKLMLEFIEGSKPEFSAFEEEESSVLLVSEQSRNTVAEINEIKERGLRLLPVFEILGFTSKELDTDEDIERAKSSTYKNSIAIDEKYNFL
jgi:hypothetical protein